MMTIADRFTPMQRAAMEKRKLISQNRPPVSEDDAANPGKSPEDRVRRIPEIPPVREGQAIKDPERPVRIPEPGIKRPTKDTSMARTARRRLEGFV